MLKPSLLTATLLLLSSHVTLAEQPDLNFINVGYTTYSESTRFVFADNFKGISATASYELTDNLYVPVTIAIVGGDRDARQFVGSVVSDSNIDQLAQDISIGLGYQFSVTDKSIFTLDASYLNQKIDIDTSFSSTEQSLFETLGIQQGEVLSESESENLFMLRLGYHYKFNSQWQIGVGGAWRSDTLSDKIGSERNATADLLYSVTDDWALSLHAEVGEARFSTIGLQYDF